MSDEPQRFRVSEHRKAPPVGVKLAAALIQLGFTSEEVQTPGAIEWQHDPPLIQREWDEAAGDFDPPQHDPRFLRPLRKAEHKVESYGPGGERRIHKRNSDISEPLRLDRIAVKHDEFKARLLAPDKGKAERERKGQKPKAKWPKRPFPKASNRTEGRTK